MSIEKHIKRVIPEHRKPKFISWLESNLRKVDDVECILLEIDHSFDIDYAVGVQLDADGETVGREREVDFEPPLGISPVLDDDMYRILQKAKISINHWDGTIPSLRDLWEALFPQYAFLLYDNQNMTLNLYIMGNTTLMEWELFSRGYIAPKPEGVRIRYEFILPVAEVETKIYKTGFIVSDIETVSLEPVVMQVGVIHSAVRAAAALYADKRSVSLAPPPVSNTRAATDCYYASFAANISSCAILTDPLAYYNTF